ncbi:ABC transporter ATP-binding protein [Halopelagius longus]|uniref:ABC-type D-xylose/L-arabinose transporter n=1 Tax=Halopelagius longus TaxID=1236180 RepID=A0A1H1FMV0_9EURY|nr:sn-glycerol-3-phosphate ABC transporter ATP-binding protein UgpC [Halopelagius longus]RDI70030.1 sn-glycerol-3-phosphate ABC transporter ATP-binding protein UgpC [Halopelagius longus]SDR02059.1 carbohydrate ABC transporter ATP-binding protein, CUT1 family [Halopelagius longus]
MSNDNSNASVTFNDTRKEYGDFVAVEGFNAHIEAGEFITIVGPSGSGKSTLLRMIAGLEEISAGDIQIDGKSVRGVEPQQRGIAMVFQNYALYPHMSVRKNMAYGLKLTTDLPDDEIDERVRETATMLEIEDLLSNKPANLSGGQQQRVATGRAIVRDPKIFLMDEPLSNLDAKLKVHMRTELQRLQEELGTTTIYVTHDQEEALTMSDRIIVLDKGELQQFGTPEEIYDRPANRFVADFIGSPAMNFFDVELSGSTLLGEGFEYSIPSSIAERISDTQATNSLELGVRPEDIWTGATGENAIPATVEVVENAGSDNYLYLDIEGQECRVRAESDVKPDVGDTLRVTFDPSDIHLFDTRTGENLLVEETGVATVSDEAPA